MNHIDIFPSAGQLPLTSGDVASTALRASLPWRLRVPSPARSGPEPASSSRRSIGRLDKISVILFHALSPQASTAEARPSQPQAARRLLRERQALLRVLSSPGESSCGVARFGKHLHGLGVTPGGCRVFRVSFASRTRHEKREEKARPLHVPHSHGVPPWSSPADSAWASWVPSLPCLPENAPEK